MKKTVSEKINGNISNIKKRNKNQIQKLKKNLEITNNNLNNSKFYPEKEKESNENIPLNSKFNNHLINYSKQTINNKYGEINFPNNNGIYSKFIFITNIIINLNNNILFIQKQKSDFFILKMKAFGALSNSKNINHYLLNNIIDYYNPFNNLYQFINSKKKANNQDNIKITFKNEPNDPIKIIDDDFSTNYNHIPKINNENKNPSKISENNIINKEDILSGKEQRTVVRLSPIPPYYSTFAVAQLLDKYLGTESNKNKRIYKALYTPLCKKIGKNIGYCFIMMVSPKKVIQFYDTFNGLNFNKKRCKKKCSVIWANLQGDDFLKVSDDPIRSPIIFKDTIVE